MRNILVLTMSLYNDTKIKSIIKRKKLYNKKDPCTKRILQRPYIWRKDVKRTLLVAWSDEGS